MSEWRKDGWRAGAGAGGMAKEPLAAILSSSIPFSAAATQSISGRRTDDGKGKGHPLLLLLLLLLLLRREGREEGRKEDTLLGLPILNCCVASGSGTPRRRENWAKRCRD